jgi:hypothetical protein
VPKQGPEFGSGSLKVAVATETVAVCDPIVPSVAPGIRIKTGSSRLSKLLHFVGVFIRQLACRSTAVRHVPLLFEISARIRAFVIRHFDITIGSFLSKSFANRANDAGLGRPVYCWKMH